MEKKIYQFITLSNQILEKPRLHLHLHIIFFPSLTFLPLFFFFFEIISHFFNNHLVRLILPQPPRNLFPPKHAALNCENVFKSYQEFRGTQFHTNKRALRLESISKEVDNSIIQHSIGQLGLSGVRYNLDQSLCV